MKVFFINPPFKWEFGKFSRESRSPAVAKSGVLYYPLWLIYAAAYAEKCGFSVSFLDAPAKRLDVEMSLRRVDEELNRISEPDSEKSSEVTDKKYNGLSEPDEVKNPESNAGKCAGAGESEKTKKGMGAAEDGSSKECQCLFVLDTSTPSISSDAEFARKLKERYPGSFVYLVGTHPTATAQETLEKFPWLDGIARKEYDFTISRLAEILKEYYGATEIPNMNSIGNEENSVNHLGEKKKVDISGRQDVASLERKLSELKGISYRSPDKGDIRHNPDAEYITDLDEIPMASAFIKKHLDHRDYFFAAAEYPEVQIFTGRGCPCRCNFCVYPQTMHGHQYRLRSPKNVVDEFRYIAENFPDVKEIVIEDDTFTINKKRVSDICELLIETGMNKRFKWLCNARVNTLDLDTMKLMKRAGCRLLIPGIESGTQEILDNIKKGTTIEQVKEYIKNTKKAGLLVHACYMVGNRGETRETMQKTLNLALELNTDTAQFFPLIPYPGTEAYEWAKAQGYLKYGYDEYCKADGTHNTVLEFPGLSGEEMVKFCDDARRKYYLRPKYILHRLWTGLKDPNDLKRSLKAFGQFKKYLFKK